ncbi:uncharacterized protein DNG_06746 [Cephalotrichum gorgonifer]|uniref:Uncharacterized protein n=1 Tax=Cephalotrichum gorgonifer TaxID=2041049 RepID=A0AAE8SWU4_9PEZI|nr:uncharacterized protein DNG_06746 [Cephalotrichum gorgonifer]
MPSNHPRPKTTITLKVANRRVLAQPPTPDLSGDEGYSALEELSGESDDEDDENVYAAEEEHLIDEARGHSARSPRPVSDIEDEDDDEDDAAQDADDDGDDEGDDDDDVVDDDDEDDVYGNDDGDDESKSWNGIVTEESDTEGDLNSAFAAIHSHIPQSERHVRFANVPDSDSDSTDTDDDHADMFPDIFVDQAALDPAIRREIDRDPEESSGSGSFWDFQGGYEYSSADSDTDMFLPIVGGSFTAPPSDDEATPIATPVALQPSTAPASAVSSPTKTIFADLPVDLDGYETDGDTTEEDIPEPIVRKKSRRPDPVDDGISDSDCAPVKSNRGKPRVGRFNLDKSDKKPIAVLNPITRKMMIFTPHRHRQLDLSPEQFNFAFYSSVETTSPGVNGGGDGTTSSSTYMLDTMFASNTFGDFMNGQDLGDLGDVDAFLQGALMSEANTLDSFDSDLGADEGEKTLDINDFITFADGASESESEHDPWTADAGSTPGAPSRTADMLSHLSSATVGAFRQNQITQQLIFSNKATQDSLAFSGPFNDTALRGMKSDRLATAGTPLTPVRRRRKSSVHEPQQPPTSPLDTITQKRKATGDHEGHKRHRSISDMSMLQV